MPENIMSIGGDPVLACIRCGAHPQDSGDGTGVCSFCKRDDVLRRETLMRDVRTFQLPRSRCALPVVPTETMDRLSRMAEQHAEPSGPILGRGPAPTPAKDRGSDAPPWRAEAIQRHGIVPAGELPGPAFLGRGPAQVMPSGVEVRPAEPSCGSQLLDFLATNPEAIAIRQALDDAKGRRP